MKNNLFRLLNAFVGFNYSRQLTDKFHRWLLASDNAAAKEAALRQLWAETSGTADARTDRAFRQVMQKLGIPPASHTVRMHRAFNWKPFVAAAVVMIVSVAGTLFFGRSLFDKDPAVLQEHYAQYGVTERIDLPDGSMVYLNSGSHLYYPAGLEGATRTVYLSGEANFKVAKNPKKPFIVRSGKMKVTALGTEFNVKSYAEDEAITTSLIEGKVRVECNDTASYVLTPGYQIVYNKSTAEAVLNTVDLDDVTAWQRGECVFEKATLDEIFQTLERRYGVEFVVLGKKKHSDRYHFVFKKDAGLEEVLRVMHTVIGRFEYQLDGDVCRISLL